MVVTGTANHPNQRITGSVIGTLSYKEVNRGPNQPVCIWSKASAANRGQAKNRCFEPESIPVIESHASGIYLKKDVEEAVSRDKAGGISTSKTWIARVLNNIGYLTKGWSLLNGCSRRNWMLRMVSTKTIIAIANSYSHRTNIYARTHQIKTDNLCIDSGANLSVPMHDLSGAAH